jgi:hypothetical protein
MAIGEQKSLEEELAEARARNKARLEKQHPVVVPKPKRPQAPKPVKRRSFRRDAVNDPDFDWRVPDERVSRVAPCASPSR